jgi:indole-3-glycerol phosphate synthase
VNTRGGDSLSTPSRTVLDRILAETREEVKRRKRELPLADLQQRGLRDLQQRGLREPAQRESSKPPPVAGLEGPLAGKRRFRDALLTPGIGVIAEFKRRSPSAGVLRADADLEQVVSAYERGGAVALSVLTEGPNFNGSLEDLRIARAVCDLPVLRKDFIVDPYQLHEAWIAGADAVLLIVAALPTRELESLHDQARAIGLDVLVEVHDRAELDQALRLGVDTIGINNRDLRDFSVDVERTSRLTPEVPTGVTVVSESGIATAAQLDRLDQIGVDAALMGESLIRSPDPEATLRGLRAALARTSAAEL